MCWRRKHCEYLVPSSTTINISSPYYLMHMMARGWETGWGKELGWGREGGKLREEGGGARDEVKEKEDKGEIVWMKKERENKERKRKGGRKEREARVRERKRGDIWGNIQETTRRIRGAFGSWWDVRFGSGKETDNMSKNTQTPEHRGYVEDGWERAHARQDG